MGTTPIAMGTLAQMTQAEDPLIRYVFDHNDMATLFNEFQNGNYGALSKDGVVVLTEDYGGSSDFK